MMRKHFMALLATASLTLPAQAMATEIAASYNNPLTPLLNDMGSLSPSAGEAEEEDLLPDITRKERPQPEEADADEANEDEAADEEAEEESAEDFGPDNRIKLLPYDPNDIYTITTRVGYQTYLEFATGEEVQTISIGERSFWQVIPSGNRLFIRALADDVSTNMTIITNQRSYQMDLQSVSDPKKSITYVARFIYTERQMQELQGYLDPFMMQPVPAAPVAPASPTSMAPQFDKPMAAVPYTAAPKAAMVPVPSASQVDASRPLDTQPRIMEVPAEQYVAPAKRNYLYSFTGPEKAAPFEVFDDGTTTYFRYMNEDVIPPRVSLLDATGKEVALTPYQTNGYYAVDAIAPEMVLYSRSGTVFLFNEMLSPQM